MSDRIFFKHDMLNALLLQTVANRQPRLTAANNNNGKVLILNSWLSIHVKTNRRGDFAR